MVGAVHIKIQSSGSGIGQKKRIKKANRRNRAEQNALKNQGDEFKQSRMH